MAKATAMASTNCKNRSRIQYGVVAFLAALAALGLFLTSYEEDISILSRQAALIQNYQEDVREGSSRKPCPRSGTSKLPTPNFVIDKSAIRAQSREKLDLLKQFTRPDYEKYMMEDAGKEHYTLWHWLTKTFQSTSDCRHVVDIGTRFVASSLALGATGVPVKTFDIPTSKERLGAFREKSEEEWQSQLQNIAGVDIQFYNVDLLQVSDADFREYMSTWLIILDTHHLPYSFPFEREFLSRLVSMKPRFEGVLMLDDVHLNPEMRQWWEEVKDNARTWGYTTHDLTSVGHLSGTGMLDFSGKVVIKE